MKRLFSLVCLLICMLFSYSEAELIDRGGGLIYDTDLDITWLRDGNYANTSGYGTGHMTWNEAMAWASQLEYGGYSDWRLPTTVEDSAVRGWGYDGTTTEGFNITSSEMGYMYYSNLGNLGYLATDGTNPQSGWGLNYTGPFINIQSRYWSRTEVRNYGTHVWYFAFANGNQTFTDVVHNSVYAYAWAVRDGDSALTPEPPPLALFVTRLYQRGLNRNPDEPGLDYWVNALSSGTFTGVDVAYGFVFSQEFIGLNTSNADFLTVLYEAFFDREPDPGGYEYWLSQLDDGVSREDVLDSFIYAQEFVHLCDAYGILPFIISAEDLVRVFVTRFYHHYLDRNPDQGGLAYWADSLLSGSLTGADLAWSLVFSQEFVGRNTTNEEYLALLYRTLFDREPDLGGWNHWLGEFSSGASREDVLNAFIYTEEFLDHCDVYGVTPF